MPDTDVLTPAEAAFVAGIDVRRVNKLIDEELPSRAVRRRDGRRFVTFSGTVCLAALPDMSGALTAEARRDVFRALVRGERGEATLSATVSVDLSATIETVEQKISELRRLAKLAESDPETLGGRPCFKGTRIPVALVAELLAQGADADELLEDYPALTHEMIEAAPTLAKAYPARGRPRKKPWATAAPVSETRVARS
jgi:uncharacterized protein (DUF433 family)